MPAPHVVGIEDVGKYAEVIFVCLFYNRFGYFLAQAKAFLAAVFSDIEQVDRNGCRLLGLDFVPVLIKGRFIVDKPVGVAQQRVVDGFEHLVAFGDHLGRFEALGRAFITGERLPEGAGKAAIGKGRIKFAGAVEVVLNGFTSCFRVAEDLQVEYAVFAVHFQHLRGGGVACQAAYVGVGHRRNDPAPVEVENRIDARRRFAREVATYAIPGFLDEIGAVEPLAVFKFIVFLPEKHRKKCDPADQGE